MSLLCCLAIMEIEKRRVFRKLVTSETLERILHESTKSLKRLGVVESPAPDRVSRSVQCRAQNKIRGTSEKHKAEESEKHRIHSLEQYIAVLEDELEAANRTRDNSCGILFDIAVRASASDFCFHELQLRCSIEKEESLEWSAIYQAALRKLQLELSVLHLRVRSIAEDNNQLREQSNSTVATTAQAYVLNDLRHHLDSVQKTLVQRIERGEMNTTKALEACASTIHLKLDQTRQTATHALDDVQSSMQNLLSNVDLQRTSLSSALQLLADSTHQQMSGVSIKFAELCGVVRVVEEHVRELLDSTVVCKEAVAQELCRYQKMQDGLLSVQVSDIKTTLQSIHLNSNNAVEHCTAAASILQNLAHLPALISVAQSEDQKAADSRIERQTRLLLEYFEKNQLAPSRENETHAIAKEADTLRQAFATKSKTCCSVVMTLFSTAELFANAIIKKSEVLVECATSKQSETIFLSGEQSVLAKCRAYEVASVPFVPFGVSFSRVQLKSLEELRRLSAVPCSLDNITTHPSQKNTHDESPPFETNLAPQRQETEPAELATVCENRIAEGFPLSSSPTSPISLTSHESNSSRTLRNNINYFDETEDPPERDVLDVAPSTGQRKRLPPLT